MINQSRRNFLTRLSLLSAGLLCDNSSFALLITGKTKARLNIKKFGAVGDGITNDSEAIDKALTQIVTTGGELYFPSGVYIITRPLSYTLTKDIIISGDNAQLKFSGVFDANYALQFQGRKIIMQPLAKNVLAGSAILKVNAITPNYNMVLLLEENNYSFTRLTLSLSQTDSFSFVLFSTEDFFRTDMVGKSLVNDKDGATFLILEIQNANSVVVVPGNNQPKDIDLNKYDKWAIADLWCSSRGYYYKGEFTPGKILNKNCYICDAPIYDNYTYENTTVSQISSGKLTIHGLNIIGDKHLLFGLQLLNLINLTLDNVSVGGFLVNGVLVKQSFCVDIYKLYVDGLLSNNPSNYAVCFDSSQNVNLSSSTFSGGFHALSHGGTFPCRRLSLNQIKLSGSKNWALDFHGNSQDIVINNIISSNGAYIGGIDAKISNSIFSNDSKARGALVLAPERDSNNYQVVNCKITNLSGNAVVLANQFAISGISNTEISANIIIAGINSILLQAYPYGKSPYIGKLNIRENKSIPQTKYKNINNHNHFIIFKT